MTERELFSLPDITAGFGQMTIVVDGHRVTVPVAPDEPALYQAPDDGVFQDSNGQCWMTGWVDGQRVRRRTSHLVGTPLES